MVSGYFDWLGYRFGSLVFQWDSIECAVPRQYLSWAVFSVLPPRHHREIWSTSLLWTKFCLENGGLHRGSPFAIKRTIDWLKRCFFLIGVLHSGLLFALKTTILIGCTSGHFRGAFCLPSLHWNWEVPPRQTLNANWAKKGHWVNSGAYPECSPDITLYIART